MSKVFISYSHDSPEHTQLVLQLANALRSHGIDTELDQYHTRPPQGWPAWCEEGLRPENAEFVLVICTDTYRHRVEGRVPADEGRGVNWEGKLINSYLYNDKENARFIPILLPGANEAALPRPLLGTNGYHLKAFDLKDAQYEALYRELTRQPATTKPTLGPIIPLMAGQVSTAFFREPFHAHLSCIDKYAPAELIGREAELAMLSEAWAKVRSAESPRPHVFSFVALGGEGKTSLVAKWAAELAGQDWPGCDAVFAWSFYSQGTREQSAVSSDLFLVEALTFFGDAAMAGSAAGAFDKGRRLAQLIGERRALLILDGLEPLQSAPTAPTPGELKDQGLAALLKGLAATSHGLCVVTTRYSIPDLRAYWQTTATEVELLRLSREAGVALLKKLGVKGNQKEFEELVEVVKGHALTLSLLGTFLRDAHAGDILRRDLVRLEEADIEEQGGHAFRVMDAYVKALEAEGMAKTERTTSVASSSSCPTGLRALAILRLLGLFDRPATADCLDALLKAPAIQGLTEALFGISEAQRNMAFSRLETAKLLTVNRDAGGTLLSLDAHPLIREYFAKQLRENNTEAWHSAHRRLYITFLCASRFRPQCLEEMMPFYRAVAHGCQAGLHNRVLDKVYSPIIQRGQKGFAQKALGAGGEDLAALSWFFTRPWTEVVPTVNVEWQAWLPGNAGSRLRALTRIQQAVEPTRKSLEQALDMGLTELAAIRGRQFSELRLILGDVSGSLYHAEQAVNMADTQGDAYSERITERAVLADALHAAGLLSEASAVFHEAEELQRTQCPQHPLLYSLWGFRYYDLLLHQGLVSEVLERIAITSKWLEVDLHDGLGLLDRPLDLLSLAKCHLAQFDAGLFVDLDQTVKLIEEAIGKLMDSGKHDFLPIGFLVRASALRQQVTRHFGDRLAANHFATLAEAQLAETEEIVKRCGMLCLQVDVAVESCRLAILQGQWGQARTRIVQAKCLVKSTEHPYKPYRAKTSDENRPNRLAQLLGGKVVGYHRYNKELAAIEKAIQSS